MRLDDDDKAALARVAVFSTGLAATAVAGSLVLAVALRLFLAVSGI